MQTAERINTSIDDKTAFDRPKLKLEDSEQGWHKATVDTILWLV